MLTTYGYHYTPTHPDAVTLDGITYHRIERLPRNLREGDLLLLGDNTDKREYHAAFVTVTHVHTLPQAHAGWRRYPPECRVHFTLRPENDTWRWRSWGFLSLFYGQDTKLPVTNAYRAR